MILRVTVIVKMKPGRRRLKLQDTSKTPEATITNPITSIDERSQHQYGHTPYSQLEMSCIGRSIVVMAQHPLN